MMRDGTGARTCAIAVMAKAPRPGFCKTRLVPAVTLEQAARLSGAFLRDITENIAAAGTEAAIVPYVAYAPRDCAHLFDGHLAVGTKLLVADGAGIEETGVEGFGRCLLHAIEAMLAAGHDSAVVLNSDSPTLPTSLLVETARRLAEPGDRAVLGPADDGGYYLLGLKRAHAAMFADIAWSTARVADQTRERARSLGLEFLVLPGWYDVDDAASLRRLRAELGGTSMPGAGLASYPAPATAACLDALGLRQDEHAG